MDLADVIRRRRMCRNYSDRPVSAQLVDELLDRARRAPSAGHSQGWAFVVLEGAEQTRRFWEANSDPDWLADPDLPGLLAAPVVVIPLCNPDIYLARYSEPDKVAHGLTTADRWPAPFWTIDVAFASMLLMLSATDEGLGSLFFGLRLEHLDRVKETFDIPAEWQPIGALTVGWPAADWGTRGSAARGRLPLETIVHRGGW